MGRPKGIPNSATVEEWQTTFARWPAAQREEALRTLAAINRCIVENEKSREANRVLAVTHNPLTEEQIELITRFDKFEANPERTRGLLEVE